MTKRTFNISMSWDWIAPSNVRPENQPMGDGGQRLQVLTRASGSPYDAPTSCPRAVDGGEQQAHRVRRHRPNGRATSQSP